MERHAKRRGMYDKNPADVRLMVSIPDLTQLVHTKHNIFPRRRIHTPTTVLFLVNAFRNPCQGPPTTKLAAKKYDPTLATQAIARFLDVSKTHGSMR